MAKFVLQRIYSNDSNDSSGKNVLSTVGKVAGATALAFAGARRGAFGTNVAMKTNTMWGNLGSKLGATGMYKSAAKQMGRTQTKLARLQGAEKVLAKEQGATMRTNMTNAWANGGSASFNFKDGLTYASGGN